MHSLGRRERRGVGRRTGWGGFAAELLLKHTEAAGCVVERGHALTHELTLLLVSARRVEAERMVEQYEEADGAKPYGLVARAERRRPQRVNAMERQVEHRDVGMILLREALFAPVDPAEQVLNARISGRRKTLGGQLRRAGEQVTCRISVQGAVRVGAHLLDPTEDEVAFASGDAVHDAPVPQDVELLLSQRQSGADHAEVQEVDAVSQLFHVLCACGANGRIGGARAAARRPGRTRHGR
mmetsp:Transcript_6744/g.20422  ORF Transcript_6744/g.20422 Transcript_6744/m.20422 type:complete len:240 (+) Transcript_6744:603-1322(+)|eukprot:scaffold123396_cov30-Tisochrysis_lutea.AAC.3